MGVIEETLRANDYYAMTFSQRFLASEPARKLAVVACMDARMNIESILGLRAGEAHILRNAGGIVTEDMLRSLILSHRLLGTQEIMILHHTDCGMLRFTDADLRAQLEAETGVAAAIPARFHAFEDLEADLREQIARVRQHPWISASVPVRGFLYDVHTGRLKEVLAEPAGEDETP
ncbi:MAG TPA: carbonic anhydrase [Chthonomonadaceae bacterium]|nr:carbonic anhydrase [Chthonomonadaceae bacterium]